MEGSGGHAPLSAAGEAFAEWLARVEDGEALDFDAFCAERPEHADALRRLHARWSEHVAPIGSSPSAPAPEDAARAAALLEELERDERERYDDRGAVARGGMGEVREVYDRRLRRTLAMKVLLEGRGSEGSRGLARFLDEARISAQLDHPGVAPVHELGLDAHGRVYFTMPLIRGMHLGDVFRRVREGDAEWTLPRALSALQRVCEAVAYAHSKGVLHRDLKPANVMVGPFGETYVMDWGLAKLLGEEEPAAVATGAPVAADRGPDSASLLTQAGTVVGTPSYLAPEQAAGGAVDARADVYSIGAMLYELLAGWKPYADGRTTTPHAILAALAQGPPEALHAAAPDAPPELEAICTKAMAWDARDRYPDVLALAKDLRAFLERRVVAAYETGAVAELRKWVARNRGTASAAAAAVVVALTGAVGVAWVQAERRAEVEGVNRDLELARREEARQKGFAQARAVEVEEANRDLERSRDEEARQRAVAEARTAEVLRLSDLGRLDELEERAAALWPLRPERRAGLDAWIADAEALVARGEVEHRPTLEALRADALPYSGADRAADEAAQEGFAERDWYRGLLEERAAQLEAYRERLADGEDVADRVAQWEESVAFIESKLEPLEDLPFERRTWRFATPEAQWEHDTLAELVARIDGLAADGGRLADVRARRAETDRLERETVTGDAARAAWEAAAASISDPEECPLYDHVSLAPQFGLLPLGRDPDSGLWEFAHLQSGAPPERDPDTGDLAPTEDTGIVLVLIPGGRSILGAHSGDPARAHHDPLAHDDEAPVYAFELAPYFLSKYELTQAQWERARGDNPSDLRPGRSVTATGLGDDTTLLHPVETVSWDESVETLRRYGLSLPTEIQWERAARAGTDTPWYTGNRPESLAGHVNAADRTLAASDQLPPGGAHLEWLDDGRALHAPVGSYLPNPYGLHDVYGNVAEWCADDFTPHSNRPRAGDGLRTMLLEGDRVTRGGGFFADARWLRASARDSTHGDYVDVAVGVRPARAVDG